MISNKTLSLSVSNRTKLVGKKVLLKKKPYENLHISWRFVLGQLAKHSFFNRILIQIIPKVPGLLVGQNYKIANNYIKLHSFIKNCLRTQSTSLQSLTKVINVVTLTFHINVTILSGLLPWYILSITLLHLQNQIHWY